MALLSRKNKILLGIYIHVPFCRSKCHYCDFYSLAQQDEFLQEAYMKAVCAHVQEAGSQAHDHRVDTIYFGGGTPTMLGADALATILNTIRKSFPVAPDAEITFEANPDSVDLKLLKRLRSEGFNRVSLGIQCDDDKILEDIGRPHTYEQAVSAVKQIRRAGFKNLSLDLIYGLPGQTLESWQKTLRNVLSLSPEHISCYGLKVEEGTPLYELQDYANLPDDDMQADMYLAAVEILRSKSYRQYEISNFCRRGKESRHNLKYWNGEEYLGFGPDASSDFAGKRFKIIRDLRGYIEGIQNGGTVIEDVQTMLPRERAGEYLMTRLRTSRGIEAKEYEQLYLLPFAPIEEALELCRKRGHAQKNGAGNWRLTVEGFLVSNSIISDLLLVQEKSEPLAKRR
jgi:oxygen-independent coproporphyrinogen-3 oxidase